MNPNMELMLADAQSQMYYWPTRYIAWAIWGLIFGGIGMLVVRFLWEKRLDRAQELIKENKRLRRELDDLERQLKGRR